MSRKRAGTLWAYRVLASASFGNTSHSMEAGVPAGITARILASRRYMKFKTEELYRLIQEGKSQREAAAILGVSEADGNTSSLV